MKVLISAIALLAFLGFAGFTHAADTAAAKHHKGVVVKLDSTSGELTYKGTKANAKEHTIKTDDKTKVTVDGKDAKLADLKEGLFLTITDNGGLATEIVATTEAPAKKPA